MVRLLSFILPLGPLLVASLEVSQPLYSRDAVNGSALGASTISSAWYASWHAPDFPVSAINWSKFTEMKFAFASTTQDPSVISLEKSDEALLPEFVTAAHNHKVKAGLSIGGWTGSRWFSTNVGSAQNRTAFVKSVTDLVNKFNLDGIDLDWEYPGRQGIGCNTVNPDDTANFLLFLQELRESVGPNKTLSAATATTPFHGNSGAPLTDVSEFGKVLDSIAIMNYDNTPGPDSGVGANSPLNDTCAPPNRQFGSAASAVAQWTKAGMPIDKIVLGVPGYGHSYRVLSSNAFLNGSNTTLAPNPPYDAEDTPPGDKWDGGPGPDVCGVEQGQGGVITYWGLMEDFLNSDGSAKAGISYIYDDCSQTPMVYNPETQVMVSFDNPQSFAAKGDFIRTKGLRGFALWEAGGDYHDSLVDSILSAITNDTLQAKGVSPSSSISTSLHSRASSSASHTYSQTLAIFYSNDLKSTAVLGFLFFGSLFL